MRTRLEVAALLKRSHYPDYVVAPAVLHDVLEDTDAERSDLESRFGREVAELVALVSDDPAIADEERHKDGVREGSGMPAALHRSSSPPTRCPRSESCGR